MSENGIYERYGDAYENGGFNIGITGTVGHGDVIISDASARTPGASDVNMYVRFNWQYEGQGIATVQGNTKLSTSVGFVAINKTKKQIILEKNGYFASMFYCNFYIFIYGF